MCLPEPDVTRAVGVFASVVLAIVGRTHPGVNRDSHGCLLFVLPVPTNAPGELTSFRKTRLGKEAAIQLSLF